MAKILLYIYVVILVHSSMAYVRQVGLSNIVASSPLVKSLTNHEGENIYISEIPRNDKQPQKYPLTSIFIASTILLTTCSRASADDSSTYVDKSTGFKIDVFPGWFSMPRKTPTPSMTKYLTEEVLFVASNFAEGSSLSVTRTNARRLLKDFDIEWWFAPVEEFSDLGSADLIAELLILQRQGDFEKRTTTSELESAKLDGNTLTFNFRTPLKEGLYRKTLVKSYYKGNQILSVWLSGLASVIEGDYGEQLKHIRDSFSLI